jgi:hypothetical protein
VSAAPLFGFVQLEFGHLLGPADGRYLVRAEPRAGQQPEEALAEEPSAVLVLGTLGAPERRLRRRRRGRTVEEAQPAAAVPTARATVVRPSPFEGREQAARWLAGVRADPEAAGAQVAAAVAVVNRALRAHRVAAADPSTRDVSSDGALVVRIGFGTGDAVADGRYERAWELPGGRRRRRRSMEAPDERFSALLSGREAILACEELVLRARADLDSGRTREAALQARVALEALLVELDQVPGGRRPALEVDRPAVGEIANAALSGPLTDAATAALDDAVGRMEAALRARRLQNTRER